MFLDLWFSFYPHFPSYLISVFVSSHLGPGPSQSSPKDLLWWHTPSRRFQPECSYEMQIWSCPWQSSLIPSLSSSCLLSTMTSKLTLFPQIWHFRSALPAGWVPGTGDPTWRKQNLCLLGSYFPEGWAICSSMNSPGCLSVCSSPPFGAPPRHPENLLEL